MYTNFTNAPCGVLLKIEAITDKKLKDELFRMGIFLNSQIIRMDAESDMHTVRIKSAKGETILAGGMGGKIVAHLNDERMIPLIEMKPKECGHIETIEGGEELTSALASLGLKNGEEIEMIRCLPAMEYLTHIEGKGRVRLSEGMAAKILGSMGNKQNCQFANASAGVKFIVDKVIGGKNAKKIMQAFDIKTGDTLFLESVENASTYHMSSSERYILSTREGLRLYLRKDQVDSITVSYDV